MRKAEFTSLSTHGFHPVTYYDWGDPANPQVVICVHGLTRNGRDFDALAAALAPTHRVLAIDMPGRGESAWLRDPMDYGFATYVTTLTALVARSGARQVDWVGTSMGGLLGMVLAAEPGTPIARLVINDIGPAIEPAALARIGGYLGADPGFTTYDEAEAYIRAVSAPFGALEDAHWEALTRSSVREGPDGSWGLRYDPGIAVPFRANPVPADLWPVWEAIRVPTLVLRGRESDLLSHATAVAMTQRGPRARLVEFAAVGHAPALLTPDQIEPIVAFLRA
ncbi:MAG: alpha/beta hydrolase [Casimicrobiaceae bacterium]